MKTKNKTPKTKKQKPEIPTYKGVMGKLGKKQKEAVDELERVFRYALQLDGEANIKLYAQYRRCEEAGSDKARAFDVWHLGGIMVMTGSGNVGTGAMWMDSDAEAGNVLMAANRCLYAYGAKVRKISADEEIDPWTEARAQLEHALSLPMASRTVGLLAYLRWYAKKFKAASLADVMVSRPLGFYGGTLIDGVADVLNNTDTTRLEEQFARGLKVKPLHVFQVVLKGHDAKNHLSHHLLKHVAAEPKVFTAWMKHVKMVDFLDRVPVDVTLAEDNPAKREHIMRLALTLPPGNKFASRESGVDLRIDYDNDEDSFVFSNTTNPDMDPTFDWMKEVNDFDAQEQDRQDAKYRNSSTYQRVEEELAGSGLSNYRGYAIRPHAGHGYTLTGNDQYEDLLATMRHIDSETSKDVKLDAKPKEAKKPKTQKQQPIPKPKAKPRAKKVATKEVPPVIAEERKESADEAVASTAQATVETEPTVEEVLGEDVPWERVKKFFVTNGGIADADQEEKVIRKHLMTEYQRDTLAEMNITVRQMLNGDFPEDKNAEVAKILLDWNERLGAKVFAVPGVQ